MREGAMTMPALLCSACGVCAVPRLDPGTGPHLLKASCSVCGRYLKWIPRALVHVEKEAHTMDCLNLCVISGYLERGPARRSRDDGTTQCTCTLRVEDLGANGTIYKTYVMAEAFGKTAEALAELHRGALAMVQGKLFWRKHVTKSGEEKSGLALLVQKSSVLVPAAVEVP